MKKTKIVILFFLFLVLLACPVFSAQLETGNNFEVAFDLKEKQVLRGWLEDMPEVWTDSFGGWPLLIFLDENEGAYKLSAELQADDCFAGLGETCKYETPEFSLDSSIGDTFLYSNFNVPYHFFILFSGDNIIAPYVSVMSSSLELSQLNLSEIGIITNNANFAWEGSYIQTSRVLEGTWRISGIILGDEWTPFYGIVKITTGKVFGSRYVNLNGTGINANTGAMLSLNINFDKNAKIWMHNSTRYAATWKNVHDGSQNGFFMQLVR